MKKKIQGVKKIQNLHELQIKKKEKLRELKIN